jgi:hypothetical protein
VPAGTTTSGQSRWRVVQVKATTGMAAGIMFPVMKFAEISLVSTPLRRLRRPSPASGGDGRSEVTSRELVRQYLERIEAFDRGGPAKTHSST